MDMDVSKVDQNSVSYNDNIFLQSNFNLIASQQEAEPTVKRPTEFISKSCSDVTIVKDEVQLNTVQEESVVGVEHEIQHIQEGHTLRAQDDYCVITRQEDGPVEKIGVWLITTQGKGLSGPPTKQVGVVITFWLCM
jgi:hypothetical protein